MYQKHENTTNSTFSKIPSKACEQIYEEKSVEDSTLPPTGT